MGADVIATLVSTSSATVLTVTVAIIPSLPLLPPPAAVAAPTASAHTFTTASCPGLGPCRAAAAASSRGMGTSIAPKYESREGERCACPPSRLRGAKKKSEKKVGQNSSLRSLSRYREQEESTSQSRAVARSSILVASE